MTKQDERHSRAGGDGGDRDGFYKRLPLICLLAVVFGVGMLTLPRVMYNVGDPYAWREEARSMVLHQTLSINTQVALKFPEPGAFFVLNHETGKWYSRYGSFNGLMNVIPLAAEKFFTGELPPHQSPSRVFYLGVYFVCVSMGIAWILYEITGFYTKAIAVRLSYVLLAFYTTYLWNYLRSTSSESTQFMLIALSYLFFLRFDARPGPLEKRPRKELYLSWLAMLALCQTKISYVTLLPLLAYIVYRLARNQRMSGIALKSFILKAIIAPCVVICVAQAFMQTYKFGSPFLTGYHQFHDPIFPHTWWQATSDFLWGWQGSIFIHFPLLFLAIFGARRFIRRHVSESIFLGGCMLITYLLTAWPGGPWRGEIAYGPRYFVVFLPLLALPAIYPLEWMFATPRIWQRQAALTGLAMAACFLVFVQMQVNRMDFFFKYTVNIQPKRENYEVSINDKAPASIRDYFSNTNFAKINWDHIQCQGHWERLPYYADVLKHTNPQTLADWQHFMKQSIFVSNLYWFPDNTRW